MHVKTFSELYQQALNDAGQVFTEAYAGGLESILSDIRQQRLNSAEATLKIVEMTLSHLSDLSLMVVIALSPPYYPSIHNDEFQNLPDGVDSLTDHLIGIAKNRWQDAYQKKNYFMGLTDLSYAALQNGEDIVPVIAPICRYGRKLTTFPLPEWRPCPCR